MAVEYYTTYKFKGKMGKQKHRTKAQAMKDFLELKKDKNFTFVRLHKVVK